MMDIRLIGDWRKAEKILIGLDARYKKAVIKALNKCGIYLVGRLQRGIRNQKPGGKQYKPLHPFTIARKKSSKALIDQSDLFNAITYRVDGSRSVFVGVLKNAKNRDGKSLVNIAAIHEYGVTINVTKRMRAYLHSIGLHLKPETRVIRIPSRPTFRPVWEQELAEIEKMIAAEIQKVFGGR